MQVINWLELQPLPADLDALNGRLYQALPLRKVCQVLVETILHAYPWKDRADLIPTYHPSQTYEQGQTIALFIPDPRNVRPTVWLPAHVKYARVAENPAQGRFQVLTLDIQGRQIQMASGIPDAPYAEPDLASYSAEHLAWLVEWISNTFAASLQKSLRKLIQQGQICGRLAGEIFLPEQVSALSPEFLHPVFAGLSAAHPWISLDGIVKSLPELSQLKRESILALLPDALKESPYRSLGGGRWTTPELFGQFNREVPQGLPASQTRSKVPIWTKRDEKDLAGYDRRFMPAQARRALEELGIVERLPEPDRSSWRPPIGPVRLPALNYLHITQAYFPVGSLLRAFAPDAQMVFVQFIRGDHQPFLLDRESGLLKAVHPEKLRTRILNEDIPAGTHLWLEYEGNEQYCIVPCLLPFKRMVPCKLAGLVNGHLHIEHIQISMMYEGRPSLFKTNMRSEEMEALFAGAGRAELSVREAMIYALQELCATDPDHRAHQIDLLNAVFLQRICSPHSVLLLLYTQPCFEQLAGHHFRYKPTPVVPLNQRRKRKDRLSNLWDNLLSDPVAPDPVTEERKTAGSYLEGSYPVFPISTAELGFTSPSRVAETEPGFSAASLPLVAVEEDTTGLTLLKEETLIEAFLQSDEEPASFTPTNAVEPVSTPWRDNIDMLLHSLEELVNRGPSALPAEDSHPEVEASSGRPLEAGGEESGSPPFPFHWEPKPVWIDVPSQSKLPFPKADNTGPRVYMANIPVRPLHRQFFHQRIFFYLRGWLSRIFRKTA